jgi:tRNA threonylcarbamoyladenosine biosynthesis protein TsaB
MRVLGIETATSVCGVALVDGMRVQAERSLDERYAHAERLFGFLDEVLESAAVGLPAIQGIGVSIGPGSFTGLRIGLSVAKGLHLATGIPVVAVPTLEALALHGSADARAAGGDALLAVLDARRGEVYWQLFVPGDPMVRVLTDVHDGPVQEIIGSIPPGRIVVTGEARQQVADGLVTAGMQASRVHVLNEPAAACSAVAVAMLAGMMMDAGVRHDIATLEPRYIKEFFLRTTE